MSRANPAGQDIHVSIKCDVETAMDIGSQYGIPAKAFSLKVVAHVVQRKELADKSDPEFGGWFAKVKSANLAGEGAVGVPPNLMKEGIGPFGTYQMAAEKAAFAQLDHLQRS